MVVVLFVRVVGTSPNERRRRRRLLLVVLSG